MDFSFRTIDPHYTPATGRGASLYSAIRPFAGNMHASYLDPTTTNSRGIQVDRYANQVVINVSDGKSVTYKKMIKPIEFPLRKEL